MVRVLETSPCQARVHLLTTAGKESGLGGVVPRVADTGPTSLHAKTSPSRSGWTFDYTPVGLHLAIHLGTFGVADT